MISSSVLRKPLSCLQHPYELAVNLSMPLTDHLYAMEIQEIDSVFAERVKGIPTDQRKLETTIYDQVDVRKAIRIAKVGAR